MTAYPDFEPWMDDANWATSDPDLFTFGSGGSARQARKICGACDAINQCFEYSLRTNQEDSVWGGLTPLQRRNLRRKAA